MELTKARLDFLAHEKPDNMTPEDAIELLRISHALHTLDESDCNYGLTPRQETREKRLEKKASEIARRYDLLAYHQGDPRGWSLYLVDPKSLNGHHISQAYNRGIGVPPR